MAAELGGRTGRRGGDGTRRFALLADPRGGRLRPSGAFARRARQRLRPAEMDQGNRHDLETSDVAAAVAFHGAPFGRTVTRSLPMGREATCNVFANQGQDQRPASRQDRPAGRPISASPRSARRSQASPPPGPRAPRPGGGAGRAPSSFMPQTLRLRSSPSPGRTETPQASSASSARRPSASRAASSLARRRRASSYQSASPSVNRISSSAKALIVGVMPERTLEKT